MKFLQGVEINLETFADNIQQNKWITHQNAPCGQGAQS